MAKHTWHRDKIKRALQDCETPITLPPENQSRRIWARYAKVARFKVAAKRDTR